MHGIVKADVADDPVDVGFFGTLAVMTHTHNGADFFQQLRTFHFFLRWFVMINGFSKKNSYACPKKIIAENWKTDTLFFWGEKSCSIL